MSSLHINLTQGWMPHMWGWMGWGMGWWIWIPVLLGLGYWFYTINYRPRSYRSRRQDPLEIAKTRLASGEITSEEFDEIMRKLRET